MSYEQFWDGDVDMVKTYRVAAELKDKRRNQELWLQGMYIYEALCCVSPVLRAFAKKNTKPIPYPKEPYAVNKQQKVRSEENAEKRTMEKGKAMLMALMQRQQRQKQQEEQQNAVHPDTTEERRGANGNDD
jgi:hypothetical protein